MRFVKKINTVFYRLVFSYFLLIIITTIFMGVTSYVYFSKNFNEEIEKVNGRMLSYVKRITDENIFRKTQRIYVDTTFTQPDNTTIRQLNNQVLLSLFNKPIEGNNSRIYEVYTFLQDIASRNADVVDSIQVYYRENNTVISSMHGVEFLGNEPNTEPIRWLEEVNTNFKGVLGWYHFDNQVALIGAYPYAQAGDNHGYVAILIKKSIISDLLTDSTAEQSGRLMVIEPNGIVDEGVDDSELVLTSEHIREITSSGLSDQFYLSEINGIKSMISYTTLDTTGWKLVNITPVDQFYKKSETIQRAILFICIIALIIGGIISNVFTVNMYNPLKSLMVSARKLFQDEPSRAKNVNEYTMINHVIDNLSVKVSDLEKTLTGNLPLIKNKLIEDLLKGKFESIAKINERLSLIQVEPIDRYQFFNVITLQFDESFMDNINTENSEFIKYNLLDQIESELPFNGLCLAIEDEYYIHIVVCSKQKNQDALYHVVNYITSYSYSNFMVSIVGAIGSWTANPLRLNDAFAESIMILKYRYFKPKLKILSGREYTEREQSKKELDDQYLDAFTKALKLKDEKKTEEAVKRFVEELSHGSYNADYAHGRIKEFIYQYYSFVKSMNISTRDILNDDMLMDFYRYSHVEQFRRWLMDVMKITFNYIEDKHKNKNADLIEKIKSYIMDHLEEDLSLNTIADVVYLSPRYLSRIFKQETGENFVDFVTKVRMEKAGDMIRNTEMNIEQIALKVSFNNPAYFSKKFKEVFGMTPTIYRSQQRDPNRTEEGKR